MRFLSYSNARGFDHKNAKFRMGIYIKLKIDFVVTKCGVGQVITIMCIWNFTFKLLIKRFLTKYQFSQNCHKFHILIKIIISKVQLERDKPTALFIIQMLRQGHVWQAKCVINRKTLLIDDKQCFSIEKHSFTLEKNSLSRKTMLIERKTQFFDILYIQC